MYFNTKTGKPQESALLESRTLYPKRKIQCLQFFYKMTGSPKDRLVIWVKTDDGTGAVRGMKKIKTFYGIYAIFMLLCSHRGYSISVKITQYYIQ